MYYVCISCLSYIDGHSRHSADIMSAEILNQSAKRSRKSDQSAALVAVRLCGCAVESILWFTRSKITKISPAAPYSTVYTSKGTKNFACGALFTTLLPVIGRVFYVFFSRLVVWKLHSAFDRAFSTVKWAKFAPTKKRVCCRVFFVPQYSS